MPIDPSLFSNQILIFASAILLGAAILKAVNDSLKGTSESFGLFRRKPAPGAFVAEMQRAMETSKQLGESEYGEPQRTVDYYINHVLHWQLLLEISAAEQALDNRLYSTIIRFLNRTVGNVIFIVIYPLAWVWWMDTELAIGQQSIANRQFGPVEYVVSGVVMIVIYALFRLLVEFLYAQEIDRSEYSREMRQSLSASGSVPPREGGESPRPNR